MAKKVKMVVEVVDDLDAGEGRETPADEGMTVGLNGVVVYVDLTTKHADEVRAVLGPLMKVGEKMTGHQMPRPGRRQPTGRASAGAVYEWSRTQPKWRSWKPKAGGYVPADLRKAYEKAHAS